MKLYMEDVHTEKKFLSEDKLEFVNFNYFHGKIDELPLADFVYCEKGKLSEINNKGDFIEAVTVVKPNGDEFYAWYYHWKTLIKYEWVNEFRGTRPSITDSSENKGLIVAIDDEEGNKYAFEMFNKRAEHL